MRHATGDQKHFRNMATAIVHQFSFKLNCILYDILQIFPFWNI